MNWDFEDMLLADAALIYGAIVNLTVETISQEPAHWESVGEIYATLLRVRDQIEISNPGSAH